MVRIGRFTSAPSFMRICSEITVLLEDIGMILSINASIIGHRRSHLGAPVALALLLQRADESFLIGAGLL